jgi:transcriptional regulator with XRE-family HTH domain
MAAHPTFADFLRAAREKAGITQAALAARCRLTGSYISLLESGRKPAPSDRVVKRLAEALDLPAGSALEVAHLDRAPEDLRRALDRLRKDAVRQQEWGDRLAEEVFPVSIWSLVPSALHERLRFGAGPDLEPEIVKAIDQLVAAARTAPDLQALRTESLRILDTLTPVRRRKILDAIPSLLDGGPENTGRRLLTAPEPGLPPDIRPGDVLVVDPSIDPSPGDAVLDSGEGPPVLRRHEKGAPRGAGVVVEVRRRLK